jgi:hypothetical chaperone protein
MGLRIGLDFGTTNSGAALLEGNRVRLFALDPVSSDPTVMRSVLYITREQEFSVGREAIEDYYRQNVGRPSKMVRQYVGEIEVTAADMSYIRDVYVLMDELMPGRLLRSLKSSLATSYEGTTIFGQYYSLEELIALYLRTIRERVETETGQEVEGVVLGRPVNFVGSEENEKGSGGQQRGNERAQARLRRAAQMAGFGQVAFELEPVAAALHYGLTVGEPQDIVVFDFGGGTLDITVMHIAKTGEHRVFATGGVGIAGDAFDRRIVEGTLLEHFGRGSTLEQGLEGFPDSYTDALTNWQTVLELNRPETLRFLRWAQITGNRPTRVRALESLLVNNYVVQLYDEVERAKIALSTERLSIIRVAAEDIHIWQPVSRTQFELLIHEETRRIQDCLLDTLKRSGRRRDQIDAVVRTGGSAQIPRFVDMLNEVFGPDKVVLTSVFGSVTAGLAIRAGQMASP